MSIRLAVVDDSAFVRKAIARMMQSENDIEIAGLAASGEELLAHIDEWNPTAITLDLSMPGMGGLATLDRVLEWKRVPVIILSSHSTREAPLAVEALHRGAADFIDKEEFSLVDFQGLRTAIAEKLRGLTNRPAETAQLSTVRVPQPKADAGAFDLIVIGASTGGPPAIESILESVGSLSVPLVIVQHMPAGFTSAFADRLNARLPFRVEEAAHNRRLEPGAAYIAPAGSHMRIRVSSGALFSSLGQFPETAHRPSVDVLFESAAALAPRVVGVLLTGMGEDGARGLAELHARGSLTIAQDEASSVVYGMPRAAMELGAVTEQLPLEEIGRRLRYLIDRNVLAYAAP